MIWSWDKARSFELDCGACGFQMDRAKPHASRLAAPYDLLALRFPLKATAELQAQDIFRALAGARADRSRALHPQNGALQRYVGLFVDRFGDFGTHAGGGNVHASAPDEVVYTLAVLPDELDRRRPFGSRVPS
jgi:hypothetical protein